MIPTLTKQSITLLAVSKTKPTSNILEAYEAGQWHFGENYVDEFVDKSHAIDFPDIRWHFIGHIQSNKVKKLVSAKDIHVIETLDSQKLAQKLDKEWGKRVSRLGVLVQVLTSDEGTKHGVEVKDVPSLVQFIQDSCPNLAFRGLMTMGKLND